MSRATTNEGLFSPASRTPGSALRSILVMESERNLRSHVVPIQKSLSPPTRVLPFAFSASPESPHLVSSCGSAQVRTAGVPGKAISSSASSRKACMCSPTSHPVSFRCRLHKKSNAYSSSVHSHLTGRSAMTNSLLKIGSVEGEWVRRALTALIRPASSRHMRRRSSFQPRPSRLCHMTTAQILC